MSRQPISTSAQIFQAAGLPDIAKSTRCRALRSIGKVVKVKTRPPLNRRHKEKRIVWCKKYLKLDFNKVIWSDEMRATLDGPDGWARGWLMEGGTVPVRLKRQQGGGGIMIWAAIQKDCLIGPFRVDDGVKMNSQNYCEFLSKNFLPWIKRQPAATRKKLMFMQDNAPSHASKFSVAWLAAQGFKDDTLMDWPASSPDLNPIENFWSALKRRLYVNGRQYSSKDSLWKDIQETAKSFSSAEIEKFTSGMDDRLFSVISKKGGYINH